MKEGAGWAGFISPFYSMPHRQAHRVVFTQFHRRVIEPYVGKVVENITNAELNRLLSLLANASSEIISGESPLAHAQLRDILSAVENNTAHS